jgi:hypothetical protein
MCADVKEPGVNDEGGDELGQLGSDGGLGGGAKNQHGWGCGEPLDRDVSQPRKRCAKDGQLRSLDVGEL